MKYFAFVEEGQKLENARQCPTMDTAFAVAIMANTTNPLIAVRDSSDAVITVDPSQKPVKMDWLMRSDFILAEVDSAGELCFTAFDSIVYSDSNKYIILVYYKDDYYVVGNAGMQSISELMKAVNPARIQKHTINHMIGPVTVSGEDKIVFEYNSSEFYITGSVDRDFDILEMDKSLVPDGKLLVLRGDSIGDATQMRFIGKFSSVVKLYENIHKAPLRLETSKFTTMLKHRSEHTIGGYRYYVQDSLHNYHNVKNPKIGSVEL